MSRGHSMSNLFIHSQTLPPMPTDQAQIRDMCLAYIANPNSIVLAVTAANTGTFLKRKAPLSVRVTRYVSFRNNIPHG